MPQTVGPEPQGTEACPTFTNGWTRRTAWSKQETHQSVLLITKAPAKVTIWTRRAKNLKNFYRRISLGLLLQYAGRLHRPVARAHCPCVDLYLHRFPVDTCSPNCIMFSDGLRVKSGAHPQFFIVPHFSGDISWIDPFWIATINVKIRTVLTFCSASWGLRTQTPWHRYYSMSRCQSATLLTLGRLYKRIFKRLITLDSGFKYHLR